MVDSELLAEPAIREPAGPGSRRSAVVDPHAGQAETGEPAIEVRATILGGGCTRPLAPGAPASLDPRPNVVQELSSDKFDRLYFEAKDVGNIDLCRGGGRRATTTTRGSH